MVKGFDKNLIGTRIYNYRVANHLTQKDLSVKVGVDETYIGKLENGKISFNNFNTLCNVADALNVKLSGLLEDCLVVSGTNNHENNELKYILDTMNVNSLKKANEMSILFCDFFNKK